MKGLGSFIVDCENILPNKDFRGTELRKPSGTRKNKSFDQLLRKTYKIISTHT